MFDERTATAIERISGIVLLVLGLFGGNWTFVSYGLCAPILLGYFVYQYYEPSLSNSIHEASVVPLLSVLDNEQNDKRQEEERSLLGRHTRNVLFCGVVGIFVLVWVFASILLKSTPSSRIRLVQAIGYIVAPEVEIIEPRDEQSVTAASVEPVEQIPTRNPFEEVRDAASQAIKERDAANAERDAAISERDALLRKIAAQSSTPAPSPSAPTNQTASQQQPQLPPPQPPAPAPAATRPANQVVLTENESNLLQALIDQGNSFLVSLTATKNEASPRMREELDVWVTNGQGTLRGVRGWGGVTTANFSSLRNGWKDPIAEVTALVRFLEARRNEATAPQVAGPPEAPANLGISNPPEIRLR